MTTRSPHHDRAAARRGTRADLLSSAANAGEVGVLTELIVDDTIDSDAAVRAAFSGCHAFVRKPVSFTESLTWARGWRLPRTASERFRAFSKARRHTVKPDIDVRFRPVLISLCVAGALSACAVPSGNDSVRQASEINAAQLVAVSKPAARFLVEMVDARLMDFEEGKLAAQRGTTQSIRDYGQLMMHDQTRLLSRLEVLAMEARVTVPARISDAKRDGLENLLKAQGETFDKRFIASIRIDHERDVGEFKDATQFPDIAVADFARQELALIQAHLDGIKAIEKNYP